MVSSIYLGRDREHAKPIHVLARKYSVGYDTAMDVRLGYEAMVSIREVFTKNPNNRIMVLALVILTFTLLYALSLLVLLGVVHPLLSIIVLLGVLFIIFADCVHSLLAIKHLLIHSDGVWLRLAVALVWVLFLMDVVGWDTRCLLMTAIGMATAISFFVDALVEDSILLRTTWLRLTLFFSTAAPLWLLVLLQFDLIKGRRNNVITLELPGGYLLLRLLHLSSGTGRQFSSSSVDLPRLPLRDQWSRDQILPSSYGRDSRQGEVVGDVEEE